MSEIDEIRAKYDSGKLEPIRLDLERFIRAHKAEIRKFQDRNVAKKLPPLSDEVAIKLYILQHRSINPAREIREQLEEIQREKWIRGVQTGREPDAQTVASEWSREHSAGWRAHRVTEIIYVFDREKERYVRLLQGA
jgi:hypothetical protein